MLRDDALLQFSDFLKQVPGRYSLKMEKGFKVTVGPHWKETPSRYDCFHLLYLHEGRGKYVIEDEVLDILPRRVIFMSNGVTHYTKHDQSCPPRITTSFFSVWDNVTDEKVRLSKPFYSVVDCLNSTGVAEDFDSLFYHFYYGTGDLSRNYCSVLLEKIVFDLFAVSNKMLTDEREVDPRIRRVIQFLNNNPENRLDTASLASMAGMSPDYFSRFFKKSTGMSLKHFQVSSRLRHAHYLLEFSDMRINEIAMKLNYADAYIFSKQFKEFYGVSPKDLRKPTVDLGKGN